MKTKIILLIFLILTIVLGCNLFDKLFSAKPVFHYYESSKIYYAPKSNIKIEVYSKSHVNQDFDLGYGNASIKLYRFNQKSDTVFLKTTPENIDFITFRNNKIKFECSQMQPHNLFDFLKENGFKNLDKNEIAELRDAMTLINYGPKATLLKGQTKFIKVDE